MSRKVRWYDFITVNIYFLGLTIVAQTLGLAFPLLVQQFVGETVKGTYLGTLRLWTLMAALLVQSVMGMFSDRSRSRWGKRRPFILAGTLASLIFLTAIGLSSSLSGMQGFWLLFMFAILLQVSTNTAQAAEQGLIPDLVPEDKRGRFSGVKAIFEVPLPLILVSFTIARLISQGNLWLGILLTMLFLTLSMLVTLSVPEKQPQHAPPPFDWKPVLRLALMAGAFTAIILCVGGSMRLLGRLLSTQENISLLVMAFGVAGLLAMLTAVGLGVWFSVRLSIGNTAAHKYPSFTWWVINRLAFLVGLVNIATFAVYFVQSRLGYVREKAVGPAALLMAIVGVFILVSALPSGWLADRFGRKPVVAASGLLAALGTLLALLASSLPLIYMGGILLGVSSGLFYTANWALGTDLVPKEEAGRYLGISNLAGAGAGAVGAYIGGPLADYFTLHVPQVPGLGYVILFSIYGSLFLFSVIALAKVRDTPATTPDMLAASGFNTAKNIR